MRNPTYEINPFEGQLTTPDVLVALGVEPNPILSVSLRTITHNRAGMKLQPHPVAVIEMREGDDVSSFDLTPSMARHYAARLIQIADAIEKKKAS